MDEMGLGDFSSFCFVFLLDFMGCGFSSFCFGFLLDFMGCGFSSFCFGFLLDFMVYGGFLKVFVWRI